MELRQSKPHRPGWTCPQTRCYETASYVEFFIVDTSKWLKPRGVNPMVLAQEHDDGFFSFAKHNLRFEQGQIPHEDRYTDKDEFLAEAKKHIQVIIDELGEI